MEKLESGYIKKTVTLIIETSLGDRWKSDEVNFREMKDGCYLVEEKLTD